MESEEELTRQPGVCKECKAGSTVEPGEWTGGLQWRQQAASGVPEGPLVRDDDLGLHIKQTHSPASQLKGVVTPLIEGLRVVSRNY